MVPTGGSPQAAWSWTAPETSTAHGIQRWQRHLLLRLRLRRDLQGESGRQDNRALRFHGRNRWANPNGVATNGAGNLYGTTQQGGEYDCGVILKLGTNGEYTVLYSLPGKRTNRIPQRASYGTRVSFMAPQPTPATDNCIESPDGLDSIGCGTVFKLEINGTFTVLQYFYRGLGRWAFLRHACLRDAQGNLYGTAVGGFLEIDFDYGTSL